MLSILSGFRGAPFGGGACAPSTGSPLPSLLYCCMLHRSDCTNIELLKEVPACLRYFLAPLVSDVVVPLFYLMLTKLQRFQPSCQRLGKALCSLWTNFILI